jgi:hypothetical protein
VRKFPFFRLKGAKYILLAHAEVKAYLPGNLSAAVIMQMGG